MAGSLLACTALAALAATAAPNSFAGGDIDVLDAIAQFEFRSDFEDIHTCNHSLLRRPAAARA